MEVLNPQVITTPVSLFDETINLRLYKECINKDCYLVYSRTKVKIKFDQEYVLIQYTDKSYIKIEDLKNFLMQLLKFWQL